MFCLFCGICVILCVFYIVSVVLSFVFLLCCVVCRFTLANKPLITDNIRYCTAWLKRKHSKGIHFR